jgi:hypothetical protein
MCHQGSYGSSTASRALSLVWERARLPDSRGLGADGGTLAPATIQHKLNFPESLQRALLCSSVAPISAPRPSLAPLIPWAPHAATMRMFAQKHTARALAEEAQVPVLPGSDLLKNEEEAVARAEQIGVPVLLKATGGYTGHCVHIGTCTRRAGQGGRREGGMGSGTSTGPSCDFPIEPAPGCGALHGALVAVRQRHPGGCHR